MLFFLFTIFQCSHLASRLIPSVSSWRGNCCGMPDYKILEFEYHNCASQPSWFNPGCETGRLFIDMFYYNSSDDTILPIEWINRKKNSFNLDVEIRGPSDNYPWLRFPYEFSLHVKNDQLLISLIRNYRDTLTHPLRLIGAVNKLFQSRNYIGPESVFIGDGPKGFANYKAIVLGTRDRTKFHFLEVEVVKSKQNVTSAYFS